MIKQDKVWNNLKLTFFFSFFIFTFSSMLLKYTSELSAFLQNTYLVTLNILFNNAFVSWVFVAINWFSLIFMIGAIIGFIILFYQEVIKGNLVN